MAFQREIKVKLPSGQELEVKFPTVGQMIDIESQKQLLTKGQYGRMLLNVTDVSYKMLDYVDAIATMKILCPHLLKELNVTATSLEDIAFDQSSKILEVYNQEMKPWITEILQKIKDVDKEES